MNRIKPLCLNCEKPIEGEGVTFNVRGIIYRMCCLHPCATEVARRLNDAALEQTAPRNFGLEVSGGTPIVCPCCQRQDIKQDANYLYHWECKTCAYQWDVTLKDRP